MNKTFYIPKGKAQLFKDAKKLSKGEMSLSEVLVMLFEDYVQRKRQEGELKNYKLNDHGFSILLKGKEIASFEGCYNKEAITPDPEGKTDPSWEPCTSVKAEFVLTAYITMKRKLIIHTQKMHNGKEIDAAVHDISNVIDPFRTYETGLVGFSCEYFGFMYPRALIVNIQEFLKNSRMTWVID
ncbi:hypothetical protein ACFL6I_08400 [candidate division KSB1 bacterium]